MKFTRDAEFWDAISSKNIMISLAVRAQMKLGFACEWKHCVMILGCAKGQPVGMVGRQW